MALTAEQKEINKRAVKARNAAFSARRKAYQAAGLHAEAEANAGPEKLAVEQAEAAAGAARDLRNAEVSVIEAQIRELQLQLQQTRQKYEPILERLASARREAWAAFQEAGAAGQAKVDAEYPDVANCWSAAAWKPLSEFMAGEPVANG